MQGRVVTQLATLAALFVLGPTPATAQPLTDEETFAQVFAPRAASALVPVMLIVAGASHGIVLVELRDGAAVQVPGHIVLAALLGARVRADVRAALAVALRGGQLPISELRAAKLDVVYDQERLELRIAVAAALTETSSHTLGHGAPELAATAIAPSAVSGYANLFARAGNASPNQIRADSVVNVRRWVLEAQAALNAGPIRVHRGDVLLSRDVPARALRYLAGDFAVPSGGLQLGFPILGLGVTRNYTLQPYRVIQPVGTFEFSLERPATVTVLVNGAPVQTLTLPAGRHDVRDLSLGGSANEIELLVREDSGAVRRLQFTAAGANELLAPGVVQFSLSLGFPLIEDVGLRDYAWWRPVVSGRRRWGLTDRLTLGGSIDGDLDRQVVGGAFAVGTKLGNLAADVAGSHDVHAGFGRAESMRYDYQRISSGTTTSTVTVVARHYSPRFRAIEVLDVTGRYRGDLTVASSRKLGARVFGRIGARYQVGRGEPDAYDGSVTLSRSFGALSIDALVGVRDAGPVRRDARVFVTASWRFANRSALRTQSGASAATGRSTEARYTTAPGAGAGGLVASASARESRAGYGSAVDLAYAGGRFVSSAAAAMSFDRTTGMERPTASIDAGTAIAFAGGRVAWSRPITGSFAIVDAVESMADQALWVNPAGGKPSARVDRFGPAVVPSLEPYRVGSIRVEAPSLRIGTSLGPDSHALLPTFKSGTLVLVGEPGTVFLRGTLQHPDGTPLTLAVGALIRRGDTPRCATYAEAEVQQRLDCLSERSSDVPASAPLAVMTNRAGRFSVVGVVPGRYEIRLASGLTIPVDIPRGHTGVYAAGILSVGSLAHGYQYR